MDSSEVLLRIEAEKLIAALDRHLFLRGDIFMSSDGAISSASITTAAPPLRRDVPVSLQLYPEVSLRDHLQKQEREQEEWQELNTRIVLLCLDRKVVSLTKDLLTAEYVALKPDTNVEQFKQQSVAAMLGYLRIEQNRTPDETFSIYAVTEILKDGSVGDIVTYYPHKKASWKEVQDCLTRMTFWQARAAGHPNGYTLQDGSWKYQTTRGSIVDSVMHDLYTTEHYRQMRGKMDTQGVGVLIWHELVLKASNEARARTQQLRDRRSENPEDDPLREDGTFLLEPFFNDDELPELMNQELRAPSVEALSEDEL